MERFKHSQVDCCVRHRIAASSAKAQDNRKDKMADSVSISLSHLRNLGIGALDATESTSSSSSAAPGSTGNRFLNSKPVNFDTAAEQKKGKQSKGEQAQPAAGKKSKSKEASYEGT